MKAECARKLLVRLMLLWGTSASLNAHAAERGRVEEARRAARRGYLRFYEAENVKGHAARIVNDESASGGKAVSGGTYYRLIELALPHEILRPLTLFLRVKTAKKGVLTLMDAAKTRLGETPVAGGPDWRWVTFGRIGPRLAGERLIVSPRIVVDGRLDRAYRDFRVDAAVLSEEAGLDAQAYFERSRRERERLGTHSTIVAGKATEAVSVDGKLSERAWKQALWAGPFTLYSGGEFESQHTFFSVLYDERNLYVGVRAREEALDPANNILDRFILRCRRHDDPLWKDDSVELFFKPHPERDEVVQIIANIAGAVFDQKIADRKSDQSFTSGAVSKGTTHEAGYYEQETAVPFADLGLRAARGAALRFNIARNAKNKGEVSSWCSLRGSLNAPGLFGTIVLGGETPAVQVEAKGEFVSAENDFTFRGRRTEAFSAVEGEFYVLDDTGIETRRQGFLVRLPDRDEAAKGGVHLRLRSDFKYGLRLRDPRTGDLLYQSPVYSGRMLNRVLAYRMRAGRRVRLFVNGRLVEEGGDIAGEIFLRQGANTLALEAEGGIEGALRNELLAIDLAEATFRYSRDAKERWYAPDFDDRDWRTGRPRGDTRTYYRKTIVAGLSRFTPKHAGTYTLAENLDMPMYLTVKGLEGRSLKDYRFLMEVPEAFRLKHAGGYYGGAQGYPVKLKELRRTRRDDRAYRLCEIAFGKPVTYARRLGAYHVINLVVNAGPRTEHPQDVYFWAEAEGCLIQEIVQRMPVEILPFRKVPRLKKIFANIWQSQEGSIPSPEHKRALLKCYADAGFNNVLATLPEAEEELGLTSTLGVHVVSWSVNLVDYLKAHPDHGTTDGGGSYHGETPCPEVLRTDPEARALFKQKLARLVERKKSPENIVWDYEVGPFAWSRRSRYTCFCPRCTGRFREEYGVPAARELTSDTLRSKHSGEWSAFRNKQSAETAKLFREAIDEVNRRRNTEIAFSVYSGYGHHAARYGWDWHYAPEIGLDYAMCGYGRNLQAIRETQAAIGPNIKLVGGVIIKNYGLENPNAVGPVKYKDIVQRIVDCGHVLVYTSRNITGRTLSESSKAFGMISRYEDLIADGRKSFDRIRAARVGEQEAVLYSLKAEHLALIVNHRGKAVEIPVSITGLDGTRTGREYYSGTVVRNPGSFVAAIPPEGVFAMHVE